MIVAIQRNREIWLGYRRVSTDELAAKIREAVAGGAEKKVYINADRYARYEDVRKVLSAIGSAGVENVAFLVYPRQTRPSSGE